MADTTAYQALQNKVDEDNKTITALQQRITNLQNDAGINRLRSIDASVQGRSGWIDGAGVYWEGKDASAARAAAEQYIRSQDADITAAQKSLGEAKAQLVIDTKAVTDYETNSPTLRAQLAATEATAKANIAASAAQTAMAFAEKNKTTLIIVVIVFAIVVFGVVFYRSNKNKKAAKAAVTQA